MTQLLYGLLFFIVATASAQVADYSKDLSLPKGAEVQIDLFDKKNKMVKVHSVKFPGEDASWLKTEDFGKSIEIAKGYDVRVQHELNKGDDKLVGKKFVLKQEITTYVHRSVFQNKK